MKISIITTSFNSGATIKDTIESVLLQTHTDFEHIIIDGGSTDNTIQIVRQAENRYLGRLKYISERDNGIYDAMNKGLRMATGDIIGILNSDDFFCDSDVLKTIADNIRDVDAVYGDLVFVNYADSSKIVRIWRGSQFKRGGFFRGWHPAHPKFYVKKECYDKFGKFDTTYDVSADFELMLRFLEKEGISNRYIPKTFVKMRMGGESTRSIHNIIKGNQNILRAFNNNGFKVSRFYIVRRLFPKAVNMLKYKLRHKSI